MPVYNEAATIEGIVTEWHDALLSSAPAFVMLVVNDGSKDQTSELLRRQQEKLGPRLRVFNRQNSGHGRSCRFGYEQALELGAAWVLQVDSDGQCLPEYFGELWKNRESGDCHFARRVTRGDGLGRVLISRFCRIAARIAAGLHHPDPNVPYRLIRRASLEKALKLVPPDIDMQNVALTVALSRNPENRWCYYPIHFPNRRGGVNSINLKSISRMGWRMMHDLKRVQSPE